MENFHMMRITWHACAAGKHWETMGLALAITLLCVSGASAQVRWRTGVAPRSGKTPAEAIATLAAVSQRSTERHFVVQFSEPVTYARRAALAGAGLELLSHLGDNAFFASVAPAGVDGAVLTQDCTLVDAQSIQRPWKLHPVLEAQQTPDWAVVPEPDDAVDPQPEDTWIAAYVLFHPDVPALRVWEITTAAGAVVRHQLFSVNGAVIELPLTAVDTLAANDAVQYIEPALPRMTSNNAENRALIQADVAQAPPYDLTGAGVTVLVYDTGTARTTHVDFQGRLSARDASGQATHATHVAGTIGGAGVANPAFKGMAPGVALQSYGFQFDGSGVFLYTNPGDIESDYNEAANSFGAIIANTSLGTNVAQNGFSCEYEGDYGVTSTVIDAIVRGSLGAPFRIVWAGGNERSITRCGADYGKIAPPAGAKNHITVGAVNSNDDSMTSFSSWGPTDDGRMKPDIAASGCQVGGDGGVTSCSDSSDTAYTTGCGTSFAAPTVTGCSALVIEDFKAQYPGQPLFFNSTLKAWLAHSAVDLGNVGPDYQFGYGSVRIQAAIDLMRSGAFTESEVSQGATFSRTITVNPGDPEVKVTLAWDDVPGTPNVTPALVNDLDLRVLGPNGTQYFPWTLGGVANPSAPAVRAQANHEDNIEQVLVENPDAGTWTIEVYGYGVPEGPQPFSLVGDGAGGMTINLPYGAPATIAPDVPTQLDVRIVPVGESVVPGSPTLHYRLDGGSYQSAPLSFVGDNLYLAILPPADCEVTAEYYLSAAGSATGTITLPNDAPSTVFTSYVGGYVVDFADDMETDMGWTVGDIGDDATTGIWSRGEPEPTAAQPGADHTPSPGVNCWATDHRAGAFAGTYDVDGGKTTLKSPILDLAGSTGATISYWRWYSNNQGANPGTNVFVVDISNDGGASWVNVETVGPTGAETTGGWRFHEFDVNSVIAPTEQMQMRFVAQDTFDVGAVIEAAIDDFTVKTITCAGVVDTCTDGIQNQGEDRIDCGGPCPACACTADAACDDGEFCNGGEPCDAFGECQPSTFPCDVGAWCDESGDACVPHGNGDFNDNGTIDLQDYAKFQECFGQVAGPECVAANLVGADGAIDAADIAAFVSAFTGL